MVAAIRMCEAYRESRVISGHVCAYWSTSPPDWCAKIWFFRSLDDVRGNEVVPQRTLCRSVSTRGFSNTNQGLTSLELCVSFGFAEHHRLPVRRKRPGDSNTNPSRSPGSSAGNERTPYSRLSKRYRPPEGGTSRAGGARGMTCLLSQ